MTSDHARDGEQISPVGPLVPTGQIPPWLRTVTGNVGAVTDAVLNRGGDRTRWASMLGRDRRAAAVLVLVSGSWDAAADHPGGLPADAEILLTERAPTLRQHSGQVAFPGGAMDPGDDYPVGTALREANEETGLVAEGVHVVANLPSFPVPVSAFDVIPVLAHWQRPGDVQVMDTAETSRVARVNLRALLAPESRFQVQRNVLGARAYRGPAFMVDGLLVWGFTGGLIAAISEVSGWDVPWDKEDVRPLDEAIEAAGSPQTTGFSAVLPEAMHQAIGDPDRGESGHR
ncbi:NUDIX domain-containing protein [Gordonia sp. SID5947]|uniref:NUDIX hydrolase n=1 Tax=Gordonia sp. SID5947 TaxID=2690315 RepID=UPI001369D061|nr:CoA pyrophosphatase [Gordonia sp. SID5947]MYR08041.1 NUDIX domain-containing protein [Gordonia sp. SID5947]